MGRPGRKRTLLAVGGAILSAIFAAFYMRALSSVQPAATPARRISIYRTRQSASDLAVSGMVAGLPPGAVGFVRYVELATLPKVTAEVPGDAKFQEIPPGQTISVTGIYLEVLARALGALPDTDLIDTTCTDDYRAHYPAGYMAEHHPILVLTINHQLPADWARLTHHRDLGPYFITYSHFVPAFEVLSHPDWPQLPSNVIQLNFSTIALTFGAIAPRGKFAQNSPQEEGFTIAKQNCLRCHNQGQYGGTKAGRTWMTLSTWAREQPAYFANYVRNPKSFEPHAKMPPNPEYDRATLDALTAYFRTFTEAPAGGDH
jgi:mono/diheme cytochrome c family protein